MMILSNDYVYVNLCDKILRQAMLNSCGQCEAHRTAERESYPTVDNTGLGHLKVAGHGQARL